MTKKRSIILLVFAGLTIVAIFVAANILSYRKHNPVIYARQGQWTRVEEVLHEHPSWASRKDYEGRTVLHYVASKELVEFLIDNGANVNQQDIYGYTPLHTVFNPTVIDFLLRRGADPNVQSFASKATPLHAAVNYETLNFFIMEELQLKGLPPRGDRYVFERPDKADQLAKIKLLLDAGARVNAQMAKHETPLDIAADDDVRTLLGQYGAKIVTDDWDRQLDIPPEDLDNAGKDFLDLLRKNQAEKRSPKD